MLQYQFRPIDEWPGEKTKVRKRSMFTAPFPKTLDLLERELGYLRAKNIVIQAAVALHEIRNDGMMRAGARPTWPGVILSFSSKHGDLSYPCDTYDDWTANVRAIGLALEALRSVDRYGVTRRAEQYKGWARLTGSLAMTPQEAAGVLLRASGSTETKLMRANVEAVYRAACAATHPDTGGKPEDFKRVQRAKEVIDQYYNAA